MARNKTAIAFFDFDGTLTKNDSLLKFIRFVEGDVKFFIGLVMLAPVLTLYTLKLVSNNYAKQKLLAYFFKGCSQEKFAQVASEYSLNHINKILRPAAMPKVKWHLDQGHKVVVVSASIDAWLRPWCEQEGLDLLATELEIAGGKVTGNFLTPNCYGEEKVKRIQAAYNLADYTEIYAYGDTSGDKPMLKLASQGKAFYKPFQ